MDRQKLVFDIQTKYARLSPHLNERSRRMWAAVEAGCIGRGGITIVAEATGLSRTTIHDGLKVLNSPECNDEEAVDELKQRRTGGGRKKFEVNNPNIKNDLESLVEAHTRGNPELSLKWTSRSTYNLTEELKNKGYKTISQSLVYNLLLECGYTVQSNKKSKEKANHPDRDMQFRYIAKKVEEFQQDGNPVISVDTKKKENIGEYYNKGGEWHAKADPILVRAHDFPDEKLGKVVPYGIYDVSDNSGWVSVGVSGDTAQFAVQSIKNWWYNMGKLLYPDAKSLLVTADCGGSNGYRVRLWKVELQRLANEIGLDIQVCHFPPGTSKWNKIEHRMFCHISENWRGRPLLSREVVVNLISNTKTNTGLKIQAQLDEETYETGIKIPDVMLKEVLIERDLFHGTWNYKIKRNPSIVQVI